MGLHETWLTLYWNSVDNESLPTLGPCLMWETWIKGQ